MLRSSVASAYTGRRQAGLREQSTNNMIDFPGKGRRFSYTITIPKKCASIPSGTVEQCSRCLWVKSYVYHVISIACSSAKRNSGVVTYMSVGFEIRVREATIWPEHHRSDALRNDAQNTRLPRASHTIFMYELHGSSVADYTDGCTYSATGGTRCLTDVSHKTDYRFVQTSNTRTKNANEKNST